MKIRMDFVTNSSSSSFIMITVQSDVIDRYLSKHIVKLGKRITSTAMLSSLLHSSYSVGDGLEGPNLYMGTDIKTSKDPVENLIDILTSINDYEAVLDEYFSDLVYDYCDSEVNGPAIKVEKFIDFLKKERQSILSEPLTFKCVSGEQEEGEEPSIQITKYLDGEWDTCEGVCSDEKYEELSDGPEPYSEVDEDDEDDEFDDDEDDDFFN